jgi:hypothetical protein
MTDNMDLAHLSSFTHKHCRFKLRSGREVYGVVWEVETAEGGPDGAHSTSLYFASVRDYERLQQEGSPVQVIPMQSEEIVWAESMAS